VTNRQGRRPVPPSRIRARRFTVAAVVAALAAGLAPAPAEAAIPDVARRWATLMNRSLTADATAAQLRKTLATQRTALTTRTAAATTAKAVDASAQTRLTAAAVAATEARARRQGAERSLTAAKRTLTAESKLKPRSATAVTRATRNVTAAETTLVVRTAEARAAAGVQENARTDARTATTALAAATTALQTASAAVRQTEQKLAAVGTADGHAGQAAAISRDVVTQVRAGFAVADTTSVYGVTVHSSVAFAFKRMVDDAKAAGIALSGGGFRTKERQIELRKINGCPDVWTAPASSCRVPTAIPGRSLHEIGLAVDVTSGGKTLTAKSPAFKWMVANAAEYGFVNLPSEPWHWSITGG
jgi:D-alanyl-D-alanine carboxypeptidase